MTHMHYKGTGKVHSFRGRLADGGQDKIRIQGATGEVAWRISKFQIIQYNAGAADVEAIMQIWRERHPDAGGDIPEWNVIDFTNDELLGAAFMSIRDSSAGSTIPSVIFDNELFSRNIFITYFDKQVGQPCNYYIELEKVKLSKAGMAQLAVAAARRTTTGYTSP